MDAFWKWLMQANARAVLLAGILILLAISGWWGWRLSIPLESKIAHSKFQTMEKEPSFLLELNNFLNTQLAFTNMPTQNPFGHIPQVPVKPPPPPPVKPQTTNTVSVPPQQPIKPPPQPPKPKEIVKIIYHGMLKRPDGKILAWIEDSKTGKSSFYEKGGKMGDITILKIKETELTIKQTDGSVIKLIINEPATFEEGKYVNR